MSNHSTQRQRTHSTVQLQSGTVVRANTMSNRLAPFWAHLLDTTSTPEPTTCGTFTGRRPESPESSTLRLFGSTVRFFAPQDPFRPIASRFGDPTSRVQVGGEVVPRNLAFKLLHVYDALRQTVSSTHHLDVPRHAPSDILELCAEVLALYSPGDHLAPTRTKNILSAKRPVEEHLLLLPDETYIFRSISVATTHFDDFKQLVTLYARSGPLRSTTDPVPYNPGPQHRYRRHRVRQVQGKAVSRHTRLSPRSLAALAGLVPHDRRPHQPLLPHPVHG